MINVISAERNILTTGAFRSALRHSGRHIEVEADKTGQNLRSDLDRVIEEQAAYYVSTDEHCRSIDALAHG